jgi:hypothetical protein
MNDEQHRQGGFGAQPFGAGPFFRLAVLRFARVAVLHHAHRVWRGKKMASAAAIG